jgi:hypothetical protein
MNSVWWRRFLVLDNIVEEGVVSRLRLFEAFTPIVSHMKVKDATQRLTVNLRLLEHVDIGFDEHHASYFDPKETPTEGRWWTWPPLVYCPSEHLRSICGAKDIGELREGWLG